MQEPTIGKCLRLLAFGTTLLLPPDVLLVFVTVKMLLGLNSCPAATVVTAAAVAGLTL